MIVVGGIATPYCGDCAYCADHLGFGRSDKPTDPELYRIPRHVQRLDALLESLDLREAGIVPQDWGGPIGLSWAVGHPERVSGLFILNTYAHGSRGKIKLPLPLRLFRAPGVGEVLVKGLHLFVRGSACETRCRLELAARNALKTVRWWIPLRAPAAGIRPPVSTPGVYKQRRIGSP
jgi:pimeloyl-ACP methyl ester carboxylesterase